MSTEAVVAIDVGGTGLKGALVDRDGRVLASERRPTPRERGGEAIVEATLALARDLGASRSPAPAPALARASVPRAPDRPDDAAPAEGPAAPALGGAVDVVAVALAVPGLVDDDAGVVGLAPNLGWRELPLRAIAQERLGVPAVVWHDARAAALAEGTLGAARGVEDWLLVTIGTGIGGALVSGGRVLRGARGAAGELGHAPVVAGGPRCACGRRGCLEALASGRNVSLRYEELTGEREVAAEEIVRRADRGDAAAARTWEAAIAALATALAASAAVLDPRLVVLGGGVASAGPRLLDPLAAALDGEVRFPPAPALRVAALGERAGLVGTALAGWLDAGASREEVAAWPI